MESVRSITVGALERQAAAALKGRRCEGGEGEERTAERGSGSGAMAGQSWHSGGAKQRQRNGVGRVPVVSRGPTSCLVAVETDSAARGDTARRTLGRGRLTTVLLALARARRAGRPGWWELGAGGWACSGKRGRAGKLQP